MKEFEVDTTGAHPPPTPKDEFELIRRECQKFGDLLIQSIKLQRELGPATSPPKKPPFWERFVCRILRR